jgi:hypothetical protein
MSTTTASDLSRGLQAEALAFRSDLRQLGSELGQPRQVTPEVLAQRFCRNAVSVARQQPPPVHRRYLEEVRMLVWAELDMHAMADTLGQAFLNHLSALLDETLETITGQRAGLESIPANGGGAGVRLRDNAGADG